MVTIYDGGDSDEEIAARKLGDNIAKQFNLLGLKETNDKFLYWLPGNNRNISYVSTLVYDLKKATPNGYGGLDVEWDSAEQRVRDIIVALAVMGIASKDHVQTPHVVPDYQQLTGQNSFWDIVIPLSAIDQEKLNLLQTGAKLARDERMRINARSFG